MEVLEQPKRTARRRNRLNLWDRLMARPRLSAFLEILLFLGLALLFDYLAGAGERFWNVSPHPFWIIILLIAIQYGTNEGFLAVIAASVALLAWNLPPQSIDESIYDYLIQVVYRPMLWVIATVVVGEMTFRLRETNRELAQDLHQIRQREAAITKAYSHLKQIKETMETRLVGQLRSSIDSFNAVKAVDNLNPVQLLKGIGEVVRTITGPEQFSVYIFSPNGFEMISQKGWADDNEYAHRIFPDSPLFQALAGGQRVVCVINKGDAELLDQEGIMAGPLIDPVNNTVFGMIKIERLDFLALNQTNLETFKMMLEWAGATFAQARQYQKAYANLMHSPKSGALSTNFYKYYRAYLERVARMHQVSFFHLEIRLEDRELVETAVRVRFGRQLVEYAKDSLPRDLLLFVMKRNHSQFALIPMGADQDEIEQIEESLRTFVTAVAPSFPDLTFQVHQEQIG
ncbi:MAG: hypothetical protein RRB13_02090 [bacterium]|nr:hypothetical protein [bacterium]